MKIILSAVLLVMSICSPVTAEDRCYPIEKVIDVIDGDTIDVSLDLGFNIFYRVRVRLNGINAPESRTTDPKEKELGLSAKSFTTEWLSNSVSLVLVTEKREKFGRELGKIINEKKESLGDELIKSGLAREYHGEKRDNWFDDV